MSSRAGGEAGGDRPPDGARRARSEGLARGPAWEHGGAQRGQERAERARQRVGAALDAAVGVEQPRRVERRACARPLARARRSAPSRSSVSGFSRTRDVLGDVLEPEVVRRAEAGVVAPHDHLGAVLARRASRRRRRGPMSTTTSSRRASSGRSSARELGARAVQDDDGGEAHAGRTRLGRRGGGMVAASSVRQASHVGRRASARRRAAAGASGSARTARSASTAASASPGGYRRPAPSVTISSGPAAAGATTGPARRQRLDQREPYGSASAQCSRTWALASAARTSSTRPANVTVRRRGAAQRCSSGRRRRAAARRRA